ncbi:MAG: hypothetical protein EZS28_038401, partial [Streblomastix strix]
VKIFGKIQSEAKNIIDQLKQEKKYFPTILRLFGSSFTEVLSEAYDLIAYDFAVGADLAQKNSPNLIFQEISECGGIEILFDLFQRNLNQKSRDDAANLLTMLFIHSEFQNALMRKEIIDYYINPLINSNSNGQSIEHLSLTDLAQVAGNHPDILKDNFIAKAVQVMFQTSDVFLFDFLEIIINAGTQSTLEQIKQEISVAKIKELYQHKDSDIQEKLQIKQENKIRDVFEKCGGMIKLIQIFQSNIYKNKLIVQYSIVAIGLLHKAMKVPDGLGFAVIDELKQMSEYGGDLEIVRLSAIVLSMLAESEQNHSDIITDGLSRIISRYITRFDQKIKYQGLVFILSLLNFGSEQTKLKVKQGVSLSDIRDLIGNRDQNIVMTAQLLDQWLQFIS